MNLSSRQDTSFTSPPFFCLSAGRYLTTKEQFHEFLEAKGQEKPSQESEAVDPAGNDLAEPEAKRIRLEDGQTEDGQAEEAAEPGEQLQAQKRARGQYFLGALQGLEMFCILLRMAVTRVCSYVKIH